MRRKIRHFQLLFLGSIVLSFGTSCSDLDRETSATQKKQNALNTNIQPSQEPPQRYEAEPMTPIIGARWENVGTDRAVKANELQLFLKNFAKIPLNVSLQLNFQGMLKYKESMNLGNFNINPDEELVFPIKAADIPLQITDGVGQIYVKAIATIDKKSGPVKAIASIRPVYYQHTPDYLSVETFPEEILIEEKAGLLTGLQEGKSESKIIGRIRNVKGNVTEISAVDSRIEIKNAKGQSAGFISGMSIEFGHDEE